MSNLPDAAELSADLVEFAALYSRCVELKDELVANRGMRTTARSLPQRQVQPAVIPDFRPNSSADYVTTISALAKRRSPKHEALIKAFGDAVRATGRTALTRNQPFATPSVSYSPIATSTTERPGSSTLAYSHSLTRRSAAGSRTSLQHSTSTSSAASEVAGAGRTMHLLSSPRVPRGSGAV